MIYKRLVLLLSLFVLGRAPPGAAATELPEDIDDDDHVDVLTTTRSVPAASGTCPLVINNPPDCPATNPLNFNGANGVCESASLIGQTCNYGNNENGQFDSESW
jgi:hypothetical protein